MSQQNDLVWCIVIV